MKLRFPASLAIAGLSCIAISAHAQFSKPNFDAELLQITPERLTAFEAALKQPAASASQPAARPDMAKIQERISKAKTEAEVQQIMAELRAAHAPTGQHSAAQPAPDIGEPYQNAREAMRKWETCAVKAGQAEAARIGEATTMSAAQQARYDEARKRELAACGERPTFPESPVPPQWKESGRSFYVMLDRVETYCRAVTENPDLQLQQSSGGAVGWDSGSLDESRKPRYHMYLQTEVDAMKPRCPGLVEVMDNSLSG